jgi:hypothetical protein
MADELFSRVARWWDRDAMQSEKAALLALAGANVGLAGAWWEDLQGDIRWRVVASMRNVGKLAAELNGVLG